MDRAVIELHFRKGESYELLRTVFVSPNHSQKIIGMRGHNVPPGTESFRWTPTSQALAIFFVKAAEDHLAGIHGQPILEGRRACPAASIVRVMHKRTEGWALDLFGSDPLGRSLLLKVILVCNYLGKLPGPAQLFLRTNYLPASNIKIVADEVDITSNAIQLRALTNDLEGAWKPGTCHLRELKRKRKSLELTPTAAVSAAA